MERGRWGWLRSFSPVFFAAWWRGVFAGVFAKVRVLSVVFVVNLWWIAGETWCADGHFSGAEKLPLSQTFFSTIFARQRIGLARSPRGSPGWRRRGLRRE